MYQELLKQFIESVVNVSSTTLSQREHNLLDSFAIWLDLHAEEQSTEKDTPLCIICENPVEIGYCENHRPDKE